MSTAQTRADHDGDSQDVVPSKDRLSQSTEAPPATHADNTHTKEQTRRPYVVLRRYRFFPLLVICYVAVAATAWVLLCIMTRRPIGGRTYGPDFDRNDYDTYPTAPYLDSEYKDVFVRNERYLRAVRILQSGIAVLTIPVTSAVCSRAAVLFAQRKLSGLTLRQTMALADRGWMDLSIISKLIFGRWKQYGSRFLVLALALTTIGTLVYPLQAILVSYEPVKTPLYMHEIEDQFDLAQGRNRFGSDSGLLALQVRSRLASGRGEDVQTRLWSRGRNDPDTMAIVQNVPGAMNTGQASLANVSLLNDPFFSQVPAGLSTGLISQYAPRINSTATWEMLSAQDFPSSCRDDPDALYIRYENTTEIGYTLEICMPADMNESPWKAQRSRQDFTEELYLTMDLKESESGDGALFRPGVHTAKITMKTTAGYFELPNYWNNLTPGPLLDDDPADLKDDNPHFCYQGLWEFIAEDDSEEETDLETRNTVANATRTFSYNMDKGPLNIIALALFGQGSFLDITHTPLATYSISNPREYDEEPYGCIMGVPLVGFLKNGWYVSSRSYYECIGLINGRLADMVKSYFYIFADNGQAESTTGDAFAYEEASTPKQDLENAFTAAAFIATEAWFLDNDASSAYNRITYDLGADRLVPRVSLAGMIVISVFLGVHLLSLLLLSLYSVAWMPRWTDKLDAFAMMRIGAAVEGDGTLRAAGKIEDIKHLDETPGWVGDATGGDVSGPSSRPGEDVRVLGLGGEEPVRRGVRYHSYKYMWSWYRQY